MTLEVLVTEATNNNAILSNHCLVKVIFSIVYREQSTEKGLTAWLKIKQTIPIVLQIYSDT